MSLISSPDRQQQIERLRDLRNRLFITREGFWETLPASDIAALDFAISALASIASPQEEKNDQGAGLIHQVASPLAETEPRPTRMRIFGPHNNPEEATMYLGDVDGDLSALIANIREYLPEMTEGRRYTLRVKAMTDAEVEALPDL